MSESHSVPYVNETEMICQFNTHQWDIPEQEATTIARFLRRDLPCNQPSSSWRQKTVPLLRESDMTSQFPKQDGTAFARSLSRGLPFNQSNSGEGLKTITRQPRLSEILRHRIDVLKRELWGSRGPPESLGLETSARGKDEEICFKKESPLWREVEALEELREFPQNPTFRALESSRMDLREGQAIGLMVTFAKMVKKISTMSVDADKKEISNVLEVLQELEDNGFMVQTLRVRVRRILAKKDKQEAEDNMRRMNEITEEKREAVKEASSFLEKFKVASTLYKNKHSYLKTLEATEKTKADRIKTARMKFEALVASPLY